MEMELHTVLIKIIKINLQLKAYSYYSINEKIVKKEMLNLSEYFIYNNFLKSLLHSKSNTKTHLQDNIIYIS